MKKIFKILSLRKSINCINLYVSLVCSVYMTFNCVFTNLIDTVYEDLNTKTSRGSVEHLHEAIDVAKLESARASQIFVMKINKTLYLKCCPSVTRAQVKNYPHAC